MTSAALPILHRRPGGPRTLRPGDGRRNNLALVLQSLYDEPEIARADLARRTGLTRVTISDLVAELIADDLVAEVGITSNTRPGKPATMLTVRDDSRDIVALDLSGAEVMVGAVCSPHGVERCRVSAPTGTGEAAIATLTGLIQDLLDRCEHPLLGVGIGTPGTVDPDGVVISAPNLAWRGEPLRRRLAERFGVPIMVENDANLAAIAERSFADGPDDLVRVQISRGVGAGVLVAGSVVRGASSAAGEIGHAVIDVGGAPCPCGKRGCLEVWASTPALSARIAADPARADDVLAEAGRRLGLALSPVISALDPTDIVLGGPPALVDGPFRAAAQAIITECTQSEFRDDVVLRLTSLGDHAVLLGAAALVRRATLGVS